MLKKIHIIYFLLVAGLILWLVFLLAPTYFALSGNKEISDAFYYSHKPLCHQMLTRAFCVFKNDTNLWVDNCINNETVVGNASKLTGRPHTVYRSGSVGYEFGEDARNSAIYFGLLLGTLAYPLFKKLEDTQLPTKWLLIAALIPIGIDGTTQLLANVIDWRLYWLSFLGMHESTNVLRVATGLIIGVVVPFYFLPMFSALSEKISAKKP